MLAYRFAISAGDVDSETLGILRLHTDTEAIAFGKGIVEDLLDGTKAFVGRVVRISEGHRDVCSLVIA